MFVDTLVATRASSQEITGRSISSWHSGARQTARLTGVSKDTVQRLQRQAGEHAKSMHEEQVQNVTVHEAQFDEKWSFVGKKGGATRRRRGSV